MSTYVWHSRGLFPNRNSLADGAAMIMITILSTNFFPTTLSRGRGTNPRQSVELQRPGTFEGRSTN